MGGAVSYERVTPAGFRFGDLPFVAPAARRVGRQMAGLGCCWVDKAAVNWTGLNLSQHQRRMQRQRPALRLSPPPVCVAGFRVQGLGFKFWGVGRGV